jgi:hypothetical protein
MTLQQIFDLCNYISGKELTGNAFTLDQFNLVILSTRDELMGDQYDVIMKLRMQGDAKSLSDFLTSSIVTPFVKDVTADAEDGSCMVPTDFDKFVDATVTRDGNIRRIDLVDDATFNSRRSSVGYRSNVKPFMRRVANTFYFIPLNMGKAVLLTYLRKGTTPYQDFCQDGTTFDKILIPQGSILTDAGDGTLNLMVNDPATSTYITSRTGIYLDPSRTYPYSSLTTELEFEQWSHVKFINRILSKVGLNIGEDRITAYAEMKTREDE